MASYYRSGGRDPDALPVETMSRKGITTNNSVSMVSGFLRLAYFTQPDDQTISSIVMCGGTVAAGATPTLVRGGFYSIASDGAATLVCAIANDTSLFVVASTEEVRSLSTGGGLPASYTFRGGQRYAGGLLVVTGVQAPSMRGDNQAIAANMARAPQLSAAISGQTDLPASIAGATLAAAGSTGFIQMAAV